MSDYLPITDIGAWLLALAIIMLIFGFAPGIATRLIARMFPKGDPRRAEMIAEVYKVDAWYRPIWVASQLERAFSEALPDRVINSEGLLRELLVRHKLRGTFVDFRSVLFLSDGRGIGGGHSGSRDIYVGSDLLVNMIPIGRRASFTIRVSRSRGKWVYGRVTNPGIRRYLREGDYVRVPFSSINLVLRDRSGSGLHRRRRY